MSARNVRNVHELPLELEKLIAQFATPIRRKGRMTYLDIIIELLSLSAVAQNVDEIMEGLELPKYKINPVISGLKRGIKKGKIIKIPNKYAKTLYKDHHYTLA